MNKGCLGTENTDEKCEDLKLVFYLYTKKNPKIPQKLELSSDMKNAIAQSTFDPTKENKILIHGFSDSALDTGFQLSKDNYLEKGDYNVWIFDWSVVAAGPPMNYEKVTRRMKFTAKCMSKFVMEISNLSKAGENAFHLIGHSLGAHMTGYIANELKDKLQFSRITGLDPAFPLFRSGEKTHALLRKDDAKFVDILHTSGQWFGETDPVGHVDFYLNGGFNQPACNQFGNVYNHMMAITYFAESIIEDNFYGYFCTGIDDYIAGRCPLKKPDTKMGEYVKKDISGSYIVMTNAEKPYGRGPNL